MGSTTLEPHRLLASLDRSVQDRALVGGKGASLSQLLALGAPVPMACALTIDACLAFASSAGLPPTVAAVRTEALPALRRSVLEAPLPGAVTDAIREAHASLTAGAGGGRALAVRSSATTEDSADFSFAGLHDTVPDVRSLVSLEAAVRACWPLRRE
jgi:pyruvate,water dikinase